jgi:type IV secretory pathway VirD2 relaxase
MHAGAARSWRRPSKSSGWSFDRGSGLRVRPRRVTVKARVVKLAGKVQGVAAHVRYLERDGTARDGEPGRFYSTFADAADASAFLKRGAGDRHQFRLIVSPEDGPAFADLKGFTRDLMARMEEDLGTTLDWVAVDHFDTGHPHSHILIRGVTEDGKTLNIAGDYIAHGIRHRGAQIMTRALGPQSEIEVRQQLEQEVSAERLTRLDRSLMAQAQDHRVDLGKPDPAQPHDPRYQQLLVGRARVLERMELAEKTGPLTWRLDPDAKQVLEDMGRRGDIIRTLHRDRARASWRDLTLPMPAPQEAPERLVIHGLSQTWRSEPATEALTGPIIGKVISRGTADEEHEWRYLVVEGIDARTHYVDIGLSPEPTPQGALVRLEPKVATVREVDRTVAAIAEANGGRYTIDIHLKHDGTATEDFARTHERRLEAIRRAAGKIEREPNGTWRIAPDHLKTVLAYEQRRIDAEPVKVEVLAQRPIEQMVHAHAETWLDRELAAGCLTQLASSGYGAEVRKALALRQQWLIEQELAEQQGSDVLYSRNMLRLLRQRELRAVGGQLEGEMGKRFAEAKDGERIEGTYKRSALTSGRFAMIENAREFTLVPWRPELEKHLGRNVSGLIRSTGSISWTLGRERGGPSIGM